MEWLTLVLAVGAAARLSRLVTTDEFPPVEWLRTRVFQWSVDRRAKNVPGEIFTERLGAARVWWPVKLVTCPWCVSFWVAVPVMVWAWFGEWEWWFEVPAGALTASLVAGVISRSD